MNPRFPLYIPSKSRAEIATTPRALDRMGVPYRIVVEEQQLAEYERFHAPEKLLVLDPEYQRSYDMCGDFPATASRGSGPARNFIWEHSISEGAPWHWIMDDNIQYFARFHENARITQGDGTGFNAMETFALRFKNVAMAGPQYFMFAPSRKRLPPYVTGTRIYSCNLIRNDLPFRWRGRYNEDTILSLDMLKAGWTTVQFNAFLQFKSPTGQFAGGNMEAFYEEEGTSPKSEMLVREHPDVARLMWRFGRPHHFVDYSRFLHARLLYRDDYDPSTEPVYKLRREARPY